MTRSIKVAACQVPEVRQDIDQAMFWIESYSKKAGNEDVDLVCFPECFLQGYLLEDEQARLYALDINSKSFKQILDRLTEVKPMLIFGIIEIDQGILFNTAIVVNRGCLVGRYRKTHLLPGEAIFTAGCSYPVFEIGGSKFGINICFDTQFKESAAALAVQGARLMVVPANNMMQKENAERWKNLHNKTRIDRAKESGLWVISADVTGERNGRIALGPTAIIRPDGSIAAQVPLLKVGMVVAEISR